MLKQRASGILLHPTSLPGRYGIGTLGQEAFHFIDFLVKANQQFWQILPLGPTGFADSPYQCFSSHAGNPNLIDLDLLVSDGLLDPGDLREYPSFDDGPVHFDEVQHARSSLLKTAFQKFFLHADPVEKLKFRNFLKEQGKWINDYAIFRAIKEDNGQKPWYLWETSLKMRDEETLRSMQSTLHDEIEYHKFLQYIFFRQWLSVKGYAKKRAIQVLGDIPLYVAMDSADAWANPELFEFDETRNPVRVGGVPPDYFSETGQLWGNPLFRWDVLKQTGYRWWIDRIRTNLLLYDIIRIDHFRGFAGYWAVPAGEKTAVRGEWIPGPGKDFFDVLFREFPDLPIIAEDLGVITDDVERLRDSYQIPGMKVLQFAFDSSEANDYLPYNYIKNCIVYTGTHDNDTTAGWFNHASEQDREQVLDYLDRDASGINWSFIRLAFASVAYLAIIPMQDLLGLDSNARMNIPGTTVDNWRWRSRVQDFTPELAARLAKLTALYGRIRIEKR